MITAFAICLIFSSTVPLVTLAACLFIAMRHVVDCLYLLTYFRKEIDSSGKLITTVTNTVLVFLLIYQMCMLTFFIIKKRQAEAVAVLFIMVASALYIAMNYVEVFDLSKIDESTEGAKIFDDNAFSNWKSEYEHPLVVGNVRRKANTLGVEIKMINDWEQFVDQKEVQDVLYSPTFKSKLRSQISFPDIHEERKEV
mmetsp:Transcript_7320/g.6531  ORF Transcript_7320/g.6531 Transcript_7320/m.6531 type:complete len:197 (-) Transcript_7320:60-650(-)